MRFPIIVRRFTDWVPLFGELLHPDDSTCVKVHTTHMIEGQPVTNVLTVLVSPRRIERFIEAYKAKAEVGVIFLFRKPVYVYATKRRKAPAAATAA